MKCEILVRVGSEIAKWTGNAEAIFEAKIGLQERIHLEGRATENWESVAIWASASQRRLTFCVSNWAKESACKAIAIPHATALTLTTHSAFEFGDSPRLRFTDAKLILGSVSYSEFFRVVTETDCPNHCLDSCLLGLRDTACDPGEPERANTATTVTAWVWNSERKQLYFSIKSRQCEQKYESEVVAVKNDGSDGALLCVESANQQVCSHSVRLNKGRWTAVSLSVGKGKKARLCTEGNSDKEVCVEGGRLMQWEFDLTGFVEGDTPPPSLVFEPNFIPFSKAISQLPPVPLSPPRSLQSPHYIVFVYRGYIKQNQSFSYTFENTHAAATSMTVTVTDVDAGKAVPDLYVDKPYSGKADWKDNGGVRQIVIPSTNPMLISKGGMAGSFTVTVSEKKTTGYNYEVRVLIQCPGITCYCPSGFFADPDTSHCSACPANFECTFASTMGCLPVSMGTTWTSTFNCYACYPAGVGTYLDTGTGVCLPCATVCLRCVGGLASQCATCKTGAVLQGAVGLSTCQCIAGYYPNPDAGSCAKCNTSCLTCVNGTAAGCVLCKPNATLSGLSPNTCVCNTGFYGTADNCQPCAITCLTCSGGTATSCLTCKANALLAGAAPNSCACITGYYMSAGTCVLCDLACLTCSGAGATLCTDCKANAHLIGAKPTSCVCNDGYYGPPNNCVVCDVTCSKCSAAGSSSCTACKTNATLSVTTCYCNAGFYPSPDSGSCKVCDATCLTCNGGLDSNCVLCKANAGLLGAVLSGTCICLAGFYPSPTSATCLACDLTCATCVGSTTSLCTGCKASASLYNGLNPGTCLCITQYYPSSTSANCLPCNTSCKECSTAGPAGCTVCYLNASLSAGSCVCNPGFYPGAGTQDCQACDVTCLTCSSIGATMCTSCLIPWVLSAIGTGSCGCNTICTLVCDLTCSACTGPGPAYCTSCSSLNAILYPVGSSPSFCVCNDQFYPSTTSANCLPCDPVCAKCSGGTTSSCTQCWTSAALVNSVSPGTCACLQGYYPDTTAKDCKSCDATCKTCAFSLPCSSCYPSASVVISGKCACDSGFYAGPDVAHCTPCHYTCLTCAAAGSAQCQSCYTFAVLNAVTTGSCVCQSGYYPNPSVTSCSHCDFSCKECIGPSVSSCTQCFLNAHLENGLNPGKCVCNSSFFTLTITSSCVACDPTCLECSNSGPGACLSCRANASIGGLPGPSSCNCNPSYVPVTTSANCILCWFTCQTCAGGGVGDCLSCWTNARVAGVSPANCECVDQFYPAPNAANCQACDVSCKVCSGSGDFECTQCFTNAALRGSTSPSYCDCQDSYYPNITPLNCEPCFVTCKHCSLPDEYHCTDCYPNAIIDPAGGLTGQCVCSDAFSPNPNAANCVVCDVSCNGCDGLGPYRCTGCYQFAHLTMSYCDCDSGYYPLWNTATCEPCSPFCLECVMAGDAGCVECNSFARLKGGSPSECVCGDRAFPAPNVASCKLCHYTCQTCISESESGCTSCIPGSELKSSTPDQCVCSAGTYPNLDSANCSPCASICASCSTTDECLTCKPFATLQSKKCVCIDGYFGHPDASQCLICESGCAICTSSECIRCNTGFYLYNSHCVYDCPRYYFPNDNRTCELGDITVPVPSLTVSLDNRLSVMFDKPMTFANPTLDDMSVEVTLANDIAIDVFPGQPVIRNAYEILIDLKFDANYLPEGTNVTINFLTKEKFLSQNNVAITADFVNGTLFPFGSQTNNATNSDNLSPIAQQTTTTAQGAVYAGAVMSIISGSSGTLVSMINTLQLISYMAMTQIPIPAALFQSLASLNIGSVVSIPFIDRLQYAPSDQSPPDFVQNYGINSTLFISNMGIFLLSSVVVFVSYIPVFILSRASHPRISTYFRRKLPGLKWGVPLEIWTTAYLDIGVYCLLEVIATKKSLVSGYISFNLFVAYAFSIGFWVTPVLILAFLIKYKHSMVARTDAEFNMKWGVLFLDLRQAAGTPAVCYYVSFLLRRFVFAVSLTLFQNSIWFIATINSAMSISVLPT